MQTLKKVSMGRTHSLTRSLTHSRIKLKRFLGWFARKSFVFLLTFSLIFSQLFSIFIPHVLAASSPWAQTDWVGGSGQTSLTDSTKFLSSANINTSTTGQFTLSTTTNWQYRKKITIDYTKVPSNLTNFPVLINLSSDSDLASKAQADGDDLYFTNSSGARLREV